MTTENRVKWGVMGCANIAVQHVLPAMMLAENATLLAAASRTLDKAQGVADQFGAPRAYGSYEALLADPDVEAVYIPLPNNMHKPWSIAAVEAGKHVLCEKPMALDAAEARDMQAAAKANDRLILEAFMYRHSPVVQRTIELVREGVIGELREMYASFSFVITPDAANVRLWGGKGGGAIYDVGCYCLNVLRMVAGREPVSVSATFGWSDEFDVDMSGEGVLDFDENLRGLFSARFDSSGGSYFRAKGTKGSLELCVGFLGREPLPQIVVSVGAVKKTIAVPGPSPYTLEIEDMGRAVRGEADSIYAWEPLDANMKVIDASLESWRTGKRVSI